MVFEKLQQVRKMITQLAVCWTILISKTDKMIALNLSKQQLDADPKVIQQIKQQLQQCFSLLKRQQELH